MRHIWFGVAAVLLVCLGLAGTTLGAAVMSIDLGSEWLKVTHNHSTPRVSENT